MRESLEHVGRFDPVRARQRFTENFSAEVTRHVVVAGVRVGCVVVRPAEQGLLLDHLYFWPEHQGKGYGSAVLSVLFAEADAQQAQIRVGALKGSRSNAFYARHGFELIEVAEWDSYYVRHPGPAVIRDRRDTGSS